MSMLRTSDKGLSWETVVPQFIGPTLTQGDWKEAYVYAFDTLPDPNDPEYILVYYNARNGWENGSETVGVSKFPNLMVRHAKHNVTLRRRNTAPIQVRLV